MTPDDVLPLHLADVTFPDTHPLSGQTGEVFGFGVRTSGGLVLFDTGIGRGNELLDRYYGVAHRPLDEALAEHGLAVADVRAIVNSHLHFDHCGNNLLFPGVPIYVQAAERVAARAARYTVPEWVDFEGAEYRVIDGEEQVASDVRVVATPGHTPGHQSLVLDTRDGVIVLAGQAIYSATECEQLVDTGDVPPDDPAPDPERYRASALALLALRPVRMHFSHDRAAWDRPSPGTERP